ncbi:MAG TPA: hypothetical protein VEA40_04905 [Ramlibacter sp.]|nr:hypothetical protein [Ramlibacter sp.]
MDVELRTPGVRLARAHGFDLVRRVRTCFERLRHRVARVVVRVHEGARFHDRTCVVEVHMTDGHVERVQERQRKLGALVQRALHRAWQSVARRVAREVENRPVLRLQGRRSPAHV